MNQSSLTCSLKPNKRNRKLRRTRKLLLLVLAVAPVALHGAKGPIKIPEYHFSVYSGAPMSYNQARKIFRKQCKKTDSFDKFWKTNAQVTSVFCQQ